MDILAALKKSPGFVYQIGTQYYYLGRYICKPCADMEVTDTCAMFDICASSGEVQNEAFYFQKLRAYSDFALEAPFNPVKLASDMEALIASLSDFQKNALEKQYLRFAKNLGLD